MPFELVMGVRHILDKQLQGKKEVVLQRKSKEDHSTRKIYLSSAQHLKERDRREEKGEIGADPIESYSVL